MTEQAMHGVTPSVCGGALVALGCGHSVLKFVPQFKVIGQTEIKWRGHRPFEVGNEVEAPIELVSRKVERDRCPAQLGTLSEQDSCDIVVSDAAVKEEVEHSKLRKE